MNRCYSAFLIRLWQRDDGSQRIEIEHVQAGTRAVVASPEAAVTWLTDHADDSPAQPKQTPTADTRHDEHRNPE